MSAAAELLTEIIPKNAFYSAKFSAANVGVKCQLKELPFTTKAELLADQAAHPPFGSNLTYPIEKYTRYHQTSGTTGQPLRWLDTNDSWQWVVSCWRQVYEFAGITVKDRVFFPFSFGPFLGFWSAFDAAAHLGSLTMPGGGMTSIARLRFVLENEATILVCTPTYALHLSEVAREQGIDLAKSPVRTLIVAGEPGGSIPATRQRIEHSWGARLIDHSGLTEVGPLSVECLQAPGGLHILEGDYIVEIIDPDTATEVKPGEIGELIVTNLGRLASPLIRYRTGDLVKADPKPCPCGRSFLRLDGGILGRCDDLIHVRGNNVYPSAIEAILRGFDEIVEYQIVIDGTGDMTELRIQVEPASKKAEKNLKQKAEQVLRNQLLFRVAVEVVAPGSLPRFELKAKRVKRI